MRSNCTRLAFVPLAAVCNSLLIFTKQACLADAEKGRMSQPALATSEICRYALMSPRFGVLQGKALLSRTESCQLRFALLRLECRREAQGATH